MICNETLAKQTLSNGLIKVATVQGKTDPFLFYYNQQSQ